MREYLFRVVVPGGGGVQVIVIPGGGAEQQGNAGSAGEDKVWRRREREKRERRRRGRGNKSGGGRGTRRQRRKSSSFARVQAARSRSRPINCTRNYNTALPPIIITRYRFGDKTGTPRYRSTPAVRSASIQRSIIGTARYRWTVKILLSYTTCIGAKLQRVRFRIRLWYYKE